MRLAVSGSSTGVLVELEGVLASVPCRVASIVLHAAGEAAKFIAAAVRGWVSAHPLRHSDESLRLTDTAVEMDVPSGSIIHIIADDGDITEVV
jgi:hypothetical protein